VSQKFHGEAVVKLILDISTGPISDFLLTPNVAARVFEALANKTMESVVLRTDVMAVIAIFVCITFSCISFSLSY
jgi:hypothetical protein